jgi:hypothetical protein
MLVYRVKVNVARISQSFFTLDFTTLTLHTTILDPIYSSQVQQFRLSAYEGQYP